MRAFPAISRPRRAWQRGDLWPGVAVWGVSPYFVVTGSVPGTGHWAVVGGVAVAGYLTLPGMTVPQSVNERFVSMRKVEAVV